MFASAPAPTPAPRYVQPAQPARQALPTHQAAAPSPAAARMALPAPALPVSQPSPASPAGWQGQTAPPVQLAEASLAPKARGYAPETPASPVTPSAVRMLKLPTPAELGITAPTAPTATLDWNQALARLQRLGVQGFHLDQIPGGMHRVTLQLPLASAGRSQQVDVTGANAAEAVLAALEQAEAIASRAP